MIMYLEHHNSYLINFLRYKEIEGGQMSFLASSFEVGSPLYLLSPPNSGGRRLSTLKVVVALHRNNFNSHCRGQPGRWGKT